MGRKGIGPHVGFRKIGFWVRAFSLFILRGLLRRREGLEPGAACGGVVELGGETGVFLLEQELDTVEFEGEGLESGAVVGAKGFGRELAGGEGVCGGIEGGLEADEMIEGCQKVRGAAMVAQGSD